MQSQGARLSPPPLKRPRLQPPVPLPDSNSHIEINNTVGSDGETSQLQLRIFSWNVNGIASLLPPDTVAITKFFKPQGQVSKDVGTTKVNSPLRDCVRHWDWPHIVGLQEVKIASSDIKTQESVRRALSMQKEDKNEDAGIESENYNAFFCLPTDKHNATGFGGKVHGVCMLVRKDIREARIKKVDWDLEGRVLICEMVSRNLVVFNVYAVNGTDYDYRDPGSGKVIGTRHDRKRIFHTLLAAEVKKYEDQGWRVAVAGDLNVSRTHSDSFPQLRLGQEHVQSRADFHEKFIKQLGMVDSFRLLHAEKRKYTYRPTNKPWGAGGDRVDLILTTRNLEKCLLEADILDTEADRGPSDHVPLFIKLDMRIDDSPQT